MNFKAGLMTRLLLSFFAFFSITSIYAQSFYVGAGKSIDPYKTQIVKTATYKNGAVSSAHPLASEVGAFILIRGGNAFDAAAATQFALAVVYPQAGNLGGGGFITARKNNGEIITLDYREEAPAKAHRDMFLDENKDPVDGLSLNGHLASGVPGAVAGMIETAKHGRLSLKEIIDPAISLAEGGFVITKQEADNLNGLKERLLKYNTRTTAFVKESEWKTGDTLVQKELAETLKRIRDNGAKGFYEGKTAQLIVEEMQRGKGIISLQDLKNYKAKTRTALTFTYRGHEIISFPPPSSGGLLIAQMLKMVEPYPLKSYGHNSARLVHLMVEAERRAYADRAEFMGDPDFYKVPVAQLMSDNYIKERMSNFNPATASKSSDTKAGIIPESPQTTHFSIADNEGNMVSVTTTLNTSYGSKVVIGGAGFLMNNEMDDFSIKPGVPNIYGALGGEANAIAPGKRMLSSMTPTLITKNNQPFLIVGTPGGTTIPTSVFQSIVNIIDFGMTPGKAITAPKFHHQWQPDRIDVERNFPQDVLQELEKMGHTINKRSPIGRVEIILYDKKGNLSAAADTRGDDSVAGF